MMYHLHELLTKMGAPEAREKGRLEWHYFDEDTGEIAGYADIRLEAADERLVAELRAPRTAEERLQSPDHAESDLFYLVAERTARPHYYRVTKIAFDGETYARPSKGVVELGLSLFHAKALDISIRMIEQTFNKQDMLESKEHTAVYPKIPVRLRTDTPVVESFGVVIPFRPRVNVQATV